jgi:predicted transcriptional regulator
LGVFGQYYSGAVRVLDLIFHPQDEVNIYTLTPKGQKLGQAFASNVNAGLLELFLKSIFVGTIAADKLFELIPFALHIIPPNSSEQKLYREILFSEDDKNIHPTYNRRNTIQMLLKLLYENPDGIENLPSAFLRNNFENHAKNKDLENDTSTAWYLYELNELLHVSFEHFHAAFQYSIANYPTSMNDTLQKLQDKTAEAFEKESINPYKLTLNELSEQVEVEKVYDYFSLMEKSYKKDWGLCLSYALRTIAAVYKQSKDQKNQLFDFARLPENNYIRPGNAIELTADLVEPKGSLTLHEYTRVILLHVINLHTYSSYQKSRIGQGLVHNYMIESNMAWRLRDTEPSRTTPRLQNATQYLLDTGLLRKDGKLIQITEDGLKAIESL